jgi:hypothetical protein
MTQALYAHMNNKRKMKKKIRNKQKKDVCPSLHQSRHLGHFLLFSYSFDHA